MPELPEVEIIRQQLAPLVGKTIAGVEVLEPGSFRADAGSLIGKSVRGVGRHGKVLILDLKRSDLGRSQGRTLRDAKQIFVHLKMSGQLKFFNQNILNSSTKHLRIAIGFTDGSYLLFHDQRKFGWIADDPAVLPRGIDALTPQLTPKILAGILSSSSRPVKQILLDQSKIAGIGNIYASEILWQAKINPASKGLTLRTQGETLSEIRDAIREVLTEAIAFGGSTMNDRLYLQVTGQAGDYWPRRRVYGREGEPCRRCGTPIIRTVVSQRSTYWCPECQREIEKGFGTLDG